MQPIVKMTLRLPLWFRRRLDLPGCIVTVKADVSTAEGAVALIDAAAAESGHLDVLVNNAGIIRDGYLAMMSEDDWDSVIRTNLYPLFHCCKWGVRKMLARRSGAIVNISSISAIAGTAGQTNYAASKGAAISFTKSLARELGPMGIRVNAVVAGLIATDMTANLKEDQLDRIDCLFRPGPDRPARRGGCSRDLSRFFPRLVYHRSISGGGRRGSMTVPRIAITGLGIFCGAAANIPVFRDAILEGKSGVGPVDLFDVSGFQARIGVQVKGYDPAAFFSRRQQSRLSRTDQFALLAAEEALSMSGLGRLLRSL